MSAQDNLSHQLFHNAFRGIKIHSGNNFKVREDELGMHWSTNKSIAEHFGNIASTPTLTRVYSAKIPMGSVETNTPRLKERQVTSFSHEQEIPVKEGAPVLVTGVTKYRKVYGEEQPPAVKPRTRRFNPPREMKA